MGFKSFPHTPAEFEIWSERFRAASAGIPTGQGTRIFVVDAASSDAIEYLEVRSDGTPETWLIRTRRSIRYYYRYPDFEVHNSASEIALGVDIGGLDGYAVAAGSELGIGLLSENFQYASDNGQSPLDLLLAEAPAWLLGDLRRADERRQPATPPASPQPYRRRRAWARKAFDANLELFSNARPGTRNQAAFDTARRLGSVVGPGSSGGFDGHPDL